MCYCCRELEFRQNFANFVLGLSDSSVLSNQKPVFTASLAKISLGLSDRSVLSDYWKQGKIGGFHGLSHCERPIELSRTRLLPLTHVICLRQSKAVCERVRSASHNGRGCEIHRAILADFTADLARESNRPLSHNGRGRSSEKGRVRESLM